MNRIAYQLTGIALLCLSGCDSHNSSGETSVQLRWVYGYNQAGGPEAAPIALADSVLIATAGLDMVALYVADGSVKWKTRATEDYTMQSEGPTHDNGRLYTAHETGSYEAYYAFDLETGKITWKREVDNELLAVASGSQYAVQDDVVYAPQYRGIIYGLDGATGQLVKTLDYDIAAVNSVTSADDGLYVGLWDSHNSSPSGDVEGYLIKLCRGSLEEAWRFHLVGGGFGGAPPIINGDIVYISAGSGFTLALDAETGQEIWRLESERAGVDFNWVLADGYLYGSAPAGVFCVEAATGRLVWENFYGGAGGRHVAYLKGRVYYVQGGGITVLDAATGEQVHREESPDGYRTWKVTTAGDLLIVQTTSSILAYDVADGR